MLQGARTAGMRKLRRGIGSPGEWQEWAVRVSQNDAWQAGDAAARKTGQSPL